MSKITVSNVLKEDLNFIAKTHKDSIRYGFISTLSVGFLSELYHAISLSPSSTVYCIKKDKNITGFISGTLSTSKMYKWIIPRYGLTLLFLLLPSVLHKKNLKNIIETLFYPISPNNKFDSLGTEIIEAELLSMAVNESHRGKGMGKELVLTLENYFRDKNIKQYKVVTWSEDILSNKFYKKCGFIFSHNFSHHGNILNEYAKTIL